MSDVFGWIANLLSDSSSECFIGVHNRYGYSNFGKDWMMLTMWEVFQNTAYSLKGMIACASGLGEVRGAVLLPSGRLKRYPVVLDHE